MTFANKGNMHFALEQDRALLCAVDKFGYGNWDLVREQLNADDKLLFQHTAQCMDSDAIAKRCDYRMRQMERDLEAREKKMQNKKPANVIAAENTIKAIQEVERWEFESLQNEMKGGGVLPYESFSDEVKLCIQDRLQDREQIIERFREIEIQLRGCKELADKTKESIMRGDQYVNYSHITLKAGGQHITAAGTLRLME